MSRLSALMFRGGLGFLLFVFLLESACFSLRGAEEDTPKAKGPIPVAKLKRRKPIDFDKEILPILSKKCLACHSQSQAEAGLVLETTEAIRAGGESGPAVIPKKSAQSLLLQL